MEKPKRPISSSTTLDCNAIVQSAVENEIPITVHDRGEVFNYFQDSGHLGRNIKMTYDPEKGLIIETVQVNAIADCGHAFTDPSQIAGQCSLCQSICCMRPGCLAICEIELIAICQACYKIIKGVVVSDYARSKPFWRLRVRKILKEREAIYGSGYIQIPETTDF